MKRFNSITGLPVSWESVVEISHHGVFHPPVVLRDKVPIYAFALDLFILANSIRDHLEVAQKCSHVIKKQKKKNK